MKEKDLAKRIKEYSLEMLEEHFQIGDPSILNPYREENLLRSLEYIQSQDASAFYKGLYKITDILTQKLLGKDPELDIESVLENSDYWNEHLLAHVLLTAFPAIPTPVSSILRPGYSLAMSGYELTKGNIWKTGIHAFVAPFSYIPKIGGTVYGLPIVVKEPRMFPVYVRASTGYFRDFTIGQDYSEILKEATDESQNISEQTDSVRKIRNRYFGRTIIETMAVAGFAYLSSALSNPPDLPYIQGAIDALFSGGKVISDISAYATAALTFRDLYRTINLTRIKHSLGSSPD